MVESTHPRSYGVFKPVGHVVVALPTEADCRAADAALRVAGFADEDITAYTSEQMLAQVGADLADASPLAAIGQELNLVKVHGELARRGHSFLVVYAHDQEAADRVAEIAQRCHATRAQHYGHLLIEELIPVGSSDRQVAESSDLGLDAQTASGHEGRRPAWLLR